MFNPVPQLPYPFKSKIKQKYALLNPVLQDIPKEETVEDFKVKPLKKYFRPTFSPHPNSWIVDIGFIVGSKTYGYLFFINENTRFLFAYPTYGKSMKAVAPGFREFLNHFGGTEVRIKGDGEGSFDGIRNRLSRNTAVKSEDGPIVSWICLNPTWRRNVKFYLKDDSYGTHLTNSYCIVDAVIRVFRNILGPLFSNRNAFFQAVHLYNNTVHSAFRNRFTPRQVQEDPELEMMFVRRNEEKLETIKGRQAVDYLIFKPDNILLVHIPFEKTKKMFAKQRRNFSVLARFVRYEGGNAVINLLKEIDKMKTTLIIPVFYCKKVAESIDTLEEKYRSLL
jgi:hypothetical protein